MRALLLTLSLLICAETVSAQDYESTFGRRYAVALHFALERAGSWRQQCASMGADAETLIPVIFPELLRYSLFRSEVESLGLATLYVAEGTQAADFSIGRFQMKPSFVEALEGAVAALPSVPPALSCILEFPGAATDRDRRALRVRRLQSDAWQLLYLCCFSRVMESRFAMAPLSAVERIRLLSSAYNHGFWKTREQIDAAGLLHLYPNGRAFGRPSPYRYADVAVDFYERYWRALSSGG